MCGRFNITKTPGLDALMASLGCAMPLPQLINAAPTETIPLVTRDGDGTTTLRPARWWLTPHWSQGPSQKYAMFNARCEGLARSPAFRGPFASQRGIVPMSSFIEWRGASDRRQPWLVTTEDEALAVAALWDSWQGADRDRPLLSCTLVTTEAAESFKPWHARMPVLLAPTERDRWLDNGARIRGDDDIFAPVLKQPLRLVPLDRRVGNSRNKDPELLDAHGEWVELDRE